ncbi:MAG: hypothetical protein JO112_07275 [Planctomycetes bacterium]|nr:hypothetical protein [Planctomycetota bacterium]
MNRRDLQQLAEERILDTKALLDAGRWSGAYYLAGYAAEYALKSCILHHIEKTGMIFQDRKYLKDLGDSWTHQLDRLLDLAGLTAVLGPATGANPVLHSYWSFVKDWNERSRYEPKTEVQARALYEALTQEPDRVLRWLRTYW